MVILLMATNSYSISGYSWLFYWWLLMATDGYFIGGY